MSEKTKEISKILNSLPEWKRWNNYKDNYDTEKITVSFLDNVLLANKGEKILDFGAGFAMNEYFAQDRNIKIDSIDIDTEEVRNTFKKVHEALGLKTYLYDGVTLPFEDNSYDKIIFKASLTKMVNSNPLRIFSELLRISKPNATWHVSPPYMIPRFVTKITKKLMKSWNAGNSNNKILSDILEKNIKVAMSDWVKRSTFAFGSSDMMISDIGWLPENNFDFDAMRSNYKFGHQKATTFYVTTYAMAAQFRRAIASAAGVIAVVSEEIKASANKEWNDFQSRYEKLQFEIGAIVDESKIKQFARVSDAYKGKTYVMARGKSAGHLEELNLIADKQDTVIYVNDWKKLLTRYAFSKFSEESINIHFLNRDIELNKLEDRQYFDKTFSLIQSNGHYEEIDLIQRIENFAYGIQQSYTMMPKSMNDQVKTAGLHAVFYAVKVLERKDVEIFGLDFFEVNYLTEHVVSRKPEPQEYQPAKGKIAKEQFINLVKENPQVNFKIHTYADFSKFNLDNLTVNQLTE